MSKLILMVGESGSGKSTRANELLIEAQAEGRNCVRVNRDSIRQMLWGKDSSWDLRLKRESENLVKQIEKHSATLALNAGNDVIVDDINLSSKTQENWKQFANSMDNVEFQVERMDTSFDECVLRDMRRTGREQVGRAVIERQFLTSGRAQFGTKKIVICDIDGTLCDHEGIRSPFDETRVIFDKPYPVIVEWVKQLQDKYSVILVSGRHCSCGKDTISWLNDHYIHFDHLLMRNSGDYRKDSIIKLEILDGMLKCGVTLDQIALVLDDRPQVIEAWKSRGLKVYPVRGAVEPF
jgi:predicted kinase